MGNYPWLADSWPTTNLVHSGKEAVNCCTTNHNTAERYYNGRMLLKQNSSVHTVHECLFLYSCAYVTAVVADFLTKLSTVIHRGVQNDSRELTDSHPNEKTVLNIPSIPL